MDEKSEKSDKPDFVSPSQWTRMYHSWDPPPEPKTKLIRDALIQEACKGENKLRKACTIDKANDDRLDALHARFAWLADDPVAWKPTIRPPPHTLRTKPKTRRPPPYHLRTHPKIKCKGCLNGCLGQLAHMDEPDGCLYTPIEPIYFCSLGCGNLVNGPNQECGRELHTVDHSKVDYMETDWPEPVFYCDLDCGRTVEGPYMNCGLC